MDEIANSSVSQAAGYRREVAYQLSAVELIEAQRLMFWARVSKPRFLIVATCCFVVMISLAFYRDGMTGLPDWAAIACGIVALPFVITKGLIPWQVRRVLRNDDRFRHTWHGIIAPEAFTIATSQGDTRYPWNAFKACLSSQGVVLLVVAPTSFVPIPKWVLSTADVAAIDAYLAAANTE